jgi:hypothetical protein
MISVITQSRRWEFSTARLVFVLCLSPLLLDSRAFAQQPGPTLTPEPSISPAPSEAVPAPTSKLIMASGPEVLPGLPQPPDQPGSLLLAPNQAFTCDPIPGPYFDCDPRLDPPVLPQPGWLVDVEVGILLPHVVNDMHDAVKVNGVTSRVQLPGGGLDWTAAPRIELGYRLPEGFGEIDLAYRFLGAQGTGTVTGGSAAPDGTANLLKRLDIQTADLDYASNELSICTWWMKWRLGLRGADIYFDSTADESLAAAGAGSGVFERRVTDNFWGIGPHGSLELERRLTDWGLTVIGRLDGSVLLGRVDQGFFEVSTTHGGGGQFLTGQTLESDAMAVPQIDGSLGLAWRPQSCSALRLFVGYEYEHWWDVAHMPNTGSVGEVYNQGVLLRADFNY